MADKCVFAPAFFIQLQSELFYEINEIDWAFEVFTALRLGQIEGLDEILHVALHFLQDFDYELSHFEDLLPF